MSAKFNVAIVGATGLVGETFFEVLKQRKFPVDNLYPLASERSVGNTVMFKNKPLLVENVQDFDFSQTHFAFFSAGAEVAAKYAPIAAEQGCIVIDNSSQFRYDNDIPLIVPEVNPEQIGNYRERNIIANPNCSTIQLVVALKPIYDAAGIKRVNVATYQSVSGAGKDAIEELLNQTKQLLNGMDIEPQVFPKRIAFNILPHIDSFQDNGYTREEMKMVLETRKILGDESILVNPTAVRVPVFYGHSEAVHIETDQPLDINEVRELLTQAPGIIVVDDNDYPTLTNIGVEDAVFVGRIRQDISHPCGIDLWIVADNVRKGAALNAVQIAELIISSDAFAS